MNIPIVTNVRPLTTADVDELIELLNNNFAPTDPKHTDFDLVTANDNSQEQLVNQDFILGEVTIEGVTYKFMHGFPGDEPCGVLYTPDLQIVSPVHWSMDKGCDAITDWYLKSVNKYNQPTEDQDDDSDFEMDIPKAWFA